MMNPVLLLRVAAVISLLFAAGHTLGGVKSRSPIGETDVLAAMRTFRFEVAGVDRSYLEFYRGFGFLLGVYLLVQTILLCRRPVRGDEPAGRKTVRLDVLPRVARNRRVDLAIPFPLPVYFCAALTVCLALALFAIAR